MKTVQVKLLKSGPPNDTIFVLGSTGCGKTTLIANLALTRKRFVIIDTKEDFPETFFTGAVSCDASGFLNSLNSGLERIIVQLWKTEDQEQSLAYCCEALMRFHTANPGIETTFILDELNHFVYVNHCPDSLRDIVLRGRSVGIRKIFGAQWFGTIPTWLRDSFTEIYTFRHNDETGVERLEQFGFDPEEVRTLPQYTCLYSGKGEQEMISLIAENTRQDDKTKTTTTTTKAK